MYIHTYKQTNVYVCIYILYTRCGGTQNASILRAVFAFLLLVFLSPPSPPFFHSLSLSRARYLSINNRYMY